MTHMPGADRAEHPDCHTVFDPAPVGRCLGGRAGIEADCGQAIDHGPHPLADPETAPVLATRTPGRAARIAALHMAANWLADHQDISAPDSVQLHRHITADEEVDTATRVATVEGFARAQGGATWCTGPTMGCRVVLATRAVHGVDIDYYLTTDVMPAPGAWSRG